MMYRRLEDADFLSKWRYGHFDFRELSMSAPRFDVKCKRCAWPTLKLALYEDLNAHIELHKRVLLTTLKWEKNKIRIDIQAISEYGLQVFHLLYRTGITVFTMLPTDLTKHSQ
jgi:hypothetical protein